MASDELQVLAQLGPFTGIDNASGDPFVPAGRGIAATNTNTYRRLNALTVERGRINLADFAAYLAQINVTAPCVATPPYVESVQQQDYDQILIQGRNGGSALVTLLYDLTSATTRVVSNAFPFTKAVQYGQVIYTNGGQRLFLSAPDAAYPKLYAWQYSGFAPNATVTTSTTGGQISQEVRYYVFTQVTTMPDGTVSETTPYNYPFPLTVTTGAGSTNSVTITPGTNQFAGTRITSTLVPNLDGTSFTTNIYAQSSLQAGYFLVGNASTNTAFVDTLSDAQLATGTPLLVVDNSAFQRDPPPVGTFGIGGGRAIQNFGDIEVHKNCMFAFAHVDGAQIPAVQAITWFSIYGTPTTGESITITIGGHDEPISFTTGQTIAQVATAYANQINADANVNGLVLATTAGGLLIVQALVAGLSGNAISVQGGHSTHMTITPSSGTLTNGQDATQPQCQLWWANPGKPWEFSSDTRALLLQDPIESYSVNYPNEFSFDYNSPRGDYAKSITPCGSVLLALKKREAWIVYGDGSDQAPFSQRGAFDIGCTARRGGAKCVGGKFIVSENGLYFFDGNGPQYDEKSFRTVNTATLPVTLNDLIHSVGVFSNMTHYLFFPTLGKGYSYNTTTGEWMGELEYAPFSEDAIYYTPSDAASPGSSLANRVVAVRGSKPTSIDFLFADNANDLGNAQAYTWTGPETDAPGNEFKKEYRKLAVYAPVQQGTCTVVLTIDGAAIAPFIFDLSQRRPLFRNLPAVTQGYSVQVAITVQGVLGQPAPILWKVQVWGVSPPMRKLEINQ